MFVVCLYVWLVCFVDNGIEGAGDEDKRKSFFVS
jgi:hypothetical protein